MEKKIVGCYAILIRIGVEKVMYIQISISVKEPFLEEIQQSSLSINQMNKLNIFLYNSYFKQGRYFNETNKKSGNLVNSLWLRYLIKKMFGLT